MNLNSSDGLGKQSTFAASLPPWQLKAKPPCSDIFLASTLGLLGSLHYISNRPDHNGN